MAYQDTILARTSLVSYWRLGESSGNFADSEGSNTAVVSDVTYSATSLLTGNANTAATFDGVNDTAILGSTSALNFAATDQWSVECLVKPNTPRSGANEVNPVLGKIDASTSSRGWEVGYRYSTTGGKCRAYITMIDTVSTNYWTRYAEFDLPNASTKHIVFTSDGTGATGLRIYVDGCEHPYTTESVGTVTTTTNTVAARIGSRHNGAFFAKGTIDEISVYNDDLTPYEAVETFAITKGTAIKSTPLTPATKIIVSFDADSDVGDMGAASVMHALADADGVEILCVATGSNDAAVAELLDCANVYHQRPSIQVGKRSGADPVATRAWVATTVAACPHNLTGSSATESVTLLRTKLAAAADGSVVLVEIGYFDLMEELINSAADGISALNGSALISAKVSHVVVMGGIYTVPDANGNSAEYNFRMSPADTATFVANCPVPIYFIGYESGYGYDAGTTLSTACRASDPTRVAYAADSETGREPWDQLAVLLACRGLTDENGNKLFAAIPGGNSVNSSTGVNTWTWGVGNHYLVRPTLTNSAMKTYIEALEVAPPNPGETGFPTNWTGYAACSATPAPTSSVYWNMMLVSLDQLPNSFWSAVNATDGRDIRVTKDAAGTTLLPRHVIRFDSATKSGLLAVNWLGEMPTTGGKPYIWAGNPSATEPAADSYYGSESAYETWVRGFWPAGLSDDATLYDNDLTLLGTPTVGGASGPINGSKATTLNGTTQLGHTSVAVPGSMPLTLVASVKSTSTTVDQCIMAVTDTAGSTNYFITQLEGAQTNDPSSARINSGTTAASTLNTYTSGAWLDQAAVFASATSRTIYRNGVAGTENTTSKTPAGIDSISIGALRMNSTVNYTTGDIAMVMLCTKALTSAEINWRKEQLDDTDQSDFYGTWSWTATSTTGGNSYTSPGIGIGIGMGIGR